MPLSACAQNPAQLNGVAPLEVPAHLRAFTPLKNPVVMPAVRFFTKDGEEINLKDYRGKVLILNLWASWCMPCVQEIPAVTKAQEALKDSNVVLMGVNLESNTNQVLRFLQKKQYEGFQTWLNPSGSLPLPIAGIPTSLVLNGKGEITAIVPGYAQWDDPSVIAFVKQLGQQQSKSTNATEKKQI